MRSLSPEELILWIDVTALRIAQGKSVEEMARLGNVLNQLGDALATMSAQKALVDRQRANQGGEGGMQGLKEGGPASQA